MTDLKTLPWKSESPSTLSLITKEKENSKKNLSRKRIRKKRSQLQRKAKRKKRRKNELLDLLEG